MAKEVPVKIKTDHLTTEEIEKMEAASLSRVGKVFDVVSSEGCEMLAAGKEVPEVWCAEMTMRFAEVLSSHVELCRILSERYRKEGGRYKIWQMHQKMWAWGLKRIVAAQAEGVYAFLAELRFDRRLENYCEKNPALLS